MPDRRPACRAAEQRQPRRLLRGQRRVVEDQAGRTEGRLARGRRRSRSSAPQPEPRWKISLGGGRRAPRPRPAPRPGWRGESALRAAARPPLRGRPVRAVDCGRVGLQQAVGLQPRPLGPGRHGQVLHLRARQAGLDLDVRLAGRRRGTPASAARPGPCPRRTACARSSVRWRSGPARGPSPSSAAIQGRWPSGMRKKKSHGDPGGWWGR